MKSTLLLVMIMHLFIVGTSGEGASTLSKTDAYLILEKLLKSKNEDDVRSFLKHSNGKLAQIEIAAIEVGEGGVSVVNKMFENTVDSGKSYLAAYVLSLIGGKVSLDIISKYYHAGKDQVVKPLLPMCMSSTPEDADIGFLVDMLRQPDLTDDGESLSDEIEAAIFALGLLKATHSLDDLKTFHHKNPSGMASVSALEIANWISNRTGERGLNRVLDQRDMILDSILKSGVPRLKGSTHYYEKDKSKLWKYVDDSWVTNKVSFEISSGIPRLSFDIYVSSDNMRAAVAVGIQFERMNGHGFLYIMQKGNEGWRVRSLRRIWTS